MGSHALTRPAPDVAIRLELERTLDRLPRAQSDPGDRLARSRDGIAGRRAGLEYVIGQLRAGQGQADLLESLAEDLDERLMVISNVSPYARGFDASLQTALERIRPGH